jgi:hypothetical protein
VTLLPLLWLASQAFAQGTLSLVASNGPPAARYNIVVLSEGYTSVQLAQFRTDATNAINTLLAREPYAEYRRYFNAYAISVASVQSGSDHPSYPQTRDTYFNSAYDASDRIITIPTGVKGQLKVESLLNTHVPEWDLAILLVNDPVPGGSDGAGKTAVVSVPGISDMLIHETGHVVAGLGDEYTTPFAGYPDTEEPNTTTETNHAKIKWKAWIEPSTPVPTPVSYDYDGLIGLFEGAHYHETGWYRPRLNCMMQSQYTTDFCEVCREAMVLAFYNVVRPITSVVPLQSRLFPSSNSPISFSATLQEPATHRITVQWELNGTVIPNAAQQNITLHPATLRPGTNTIKLMVSDDTSFVRTDPGKLLFQTNIWTLRNDLPHVAPVIAFSSARKNADVGFAMDLSGTAVSATIETSSNLLHWVSVSECALVNGTVRYTNSEPAPFRFFRARSISY